MINFPFFLPVFASVCSVFPFSKLKPSERKDGTLKGCKRCKKSFDVLSQSCYISTAEIKQLAQHSAKS